jgi:uncharacterized protein (DUF488 family)
MREAPLLNFIRAPAVTDSTQIYSVGHSTRSEADFLALLRSFQIVQLADIRTLPGSTRHPQFNSQNLEAVLPKLGIGYAHLPKLGGLRRGLGAGSPNRGWRNANFRGYADHMLTAEFEEGLAELLALPRPLAMMCAEAVPWRCHRSLVADALLVRGILVSHIIGVSRASPHQLTSFAKVDGGRLTYPAAKEPGPKKK